MAATSSVTIDVIPKIDAEAIDTIVREAVADALRRLADSMTERTGANPTPAAADEPRFQYIQVAGREGIIDTHRPGRWSDYGVINAAPELAALDEKYVRREAEDYNRQAKTPDWDESDVDDWERIPQD